MRTPDEIVRDVCKARGIAVEAVMGRSRLRPIVWARWEVMYWLALELSWSLKAIGEFVGRDHTTVLHGLNGFADLLNERPGMAL